MRAERSPQNWQSHGIVKTYSLAAPGAPVVEMLERQPMGVLPTVESQGKAPGATDVRLCVQLGPQCFRVTLDISDTFSFSFNFSFSVAEGSV